MEFISGGDRNQITLLPKCVEEYVAEENPVRVIEAFAESLDMAELGFAKARPNETGRPMYSPRERKRSKSTLMSLLIVARRRNP